MAVYAVDAFDRTLPAVPGRIAMGSPVWVEVRPNLRRNYTLAQDILTAVGKNLELSGRGRNESEDKALAIAWLGVYNTPDLVLTHTERLHPNLVGSAIKLAEAANTNLWLVHTPPRSDAFMRTIGRRTIARELNEVPRAIALAAAPAASPEPFPQVPRTDFHLFRAHCQDQLASSALAVVEARLNAGITRACASLEATGASKEALADLVLGTLNAAPGDDELITEMRGLQVAAWHHGVFLSVDIEHMLRTEERPRASAEVVEAAIASYKQPARAIALAFAHQNVGVADIEAIKARDIDVDRSTARVSGRVIPLTPAGLDAVKAQIALNGRGPEAVLVTHKSKTLADFVNAAANDVGIRLHGRRVERTRPDSTRLLRRVGVTVNPLG